MSEVQFPPLGDDPVSATMLKVAAEWAEDNWPFRGGDREAVMDERIKFMAIVLKKLEAAIIRLA